MNCNMEMTTDSRLERYEVYITQVLTATNRGGRIYQVEVGEYAVQDYDCRYSTTMSKTKLRRILQFGYGTWLLNSSKNDG